MGDRLVTIVVSQEVGGMLCPFPFQSLLYMLVLFSPKFMLNFLQSVFYRDQGYSQIIDRFAFVILGDRLQNGSLCAIGPLSVCPVCPACL